MSNSYCFNKNISTTIRNHKQSLSPERQLVVMENIIRSNILWLANRYMSSPACRFRYENYKIRLEIRCSATEHHRSSHVFILSNILRALYWCNKRNSTNAVDLILFNFNFRTIRQTGRIKRISILLCYNRSITNLLKRNIRRNGQNKNTEKNNYNNTIINIENIYSTNSMQS